MPKLRNINPLGFVSVPLIGRQAGDEGAPYYVCDEPAECHPEHEHRLVDEGGAGSPGVGCLIPGEEFDVSPEHAAILLAQDGNYEPVKPPKSTTTTTEKGA
jgi:hypothetical protein